MRKTLGLLAIVIFVVGSAFALTIPEKVTIDAASKKQPAVVFPHAKHANTLVKTCDTCHHTNKGMTAATAKDVKKCSTCHLDPKDAAPSMREMSMQKNPFHLLCIDCHKKGKKGPVVCKDCHAKK